MKLFTIDLAKAPLKNITEDLLKALEENHISLTASIALLVENIYEHIKNSQDARATKMEIHLDDTDDQSIITVIDNGEGFSEKFLGGMSTVDYGKKLNGSTFIESDKRGQGLKGGSGRGLAQACEVLMAYEGTIVAENTAKHGASICYRSNKKTVELREIQDEFNKVRSNFSSTRNLHRENEAIEFSLEGADLFTRRQKLRRLSTMPASDVSSGSSVTTASNNSSPAGLQLLETSPISLFGGSHEEGSDSTTPSSQQTAITPPSKDSQTSPTSSLLKASSSLPIRQAMPINPLPLLILSQSALAKS